MNQVCFAKFFDGLVATPSCGGGSPLIAVAASVFANKSDSATQEVPMVMLLVILPDRDSGAAIFSDKCPVFTNDQRD